MTVGAPSGRREGAPEGSETLLPEHLLFRIGVELFAIPLAHAEEAVEGLLWDVLPDLPFGVLGVATLRGRLLPVYSPQRPLGIERSDPYGVTLVLRHEHRALGFAVDDVEDVLSVPPDSIRPAPLPDTGERVVRGVVRHGDELVALLDTAALFRACGVGDGERGGAG